MSRKKFVIIGILAVFVIVVIIAPLLFPQPAPAPGPTPSPNETFNYIVYFTPNNQVEDHLIQLIDGANSSIYAAFYDLDLMTVAEALLDAKNRGVEVKVVIDSDNMKNAAVAELVAAGIVLGDNDPDFMHNKFMIIDNRIIWTGSMNPTHNGVNKNNNNVVVITGSYELIEDYKQEFNELWNGIFGGGSPVPHPEIIVREDFILEVYFAPEDNVETQIIEEIGKAETAIYFATFTFTSKNVANSLMKEHVEGVMISGIYESFQAGKYSTYSLLRGSGIEVIKDKNPAVMHHKFFIIDNRTVIMGSFNPTRHANEDNDENILIIHNVAIAMMFATEFKKMWAEWCSSTLAPAPTHTSFLTFGIKIEYVHYDAAGDDRYNLNDEYVVIKNYGSTVVDLTGWMLEDEAGHRFLFPSFILKSGATITVYTGSGTNTQDKLYWGMKGAVWNNDHDIVYLNDPKGNLVDKYSW